MKNGERCKNGWHLKGTVPEVENLSPNLNQNLNGNRDRPSDFQFQQNSSQNQSQDFLLNMVRREMGIVLREIFQTPQVNPQQPKKQTGRDYLWALLGNSQI